MAQHKPFALKVVDDKVVYEREVQTTWNYRAPLLAVNVTASTTTSLMPDVGGDVAEPPTISPTIDENDVDAMILGTTADMKIPRKETSAFATPLDVMVFLVS